MKYSLAINNMLNDSSYGFDDIIKCSEDFKNELCNKIEKAKVSIVTAKTFLDMIEEKLKNNEYINLSETMLEASIFIGNVVGLDPSKYCEIVTPGCWVDLYRASKFVLK